MQFRKAMMAGKGDTGNDVMVMDPREKAALAKFEEESDERAQCKYCGRKFAEPAYSRHVTFCETKSKKDAMKGPGKPMPNAKA